MMTQRIALITGGSRGLGRNAALKLAEAGIDILFTWHSNQQAARDTEREILDKGVNVQSIQLDVANSSGFAAFAERVAQVLQQHWQRDRFDYLVNNAGIGISAPFGEFTEAVFDSLMAVHLKGPFFLTQHLLPLINNGGAILNVSSGLARFAVPGYAAYAAMKGGIEVLTRYQAKELGVRGIRANCIAPGAIETDFEGGGVRDNADVNRFLASQTALGRVGQPDDIGQAIVALLSDQLGWMNAQRVEVSGGMFL